MSFLIKIKKNCAEKVAISKFCLTKLLKIVENGDDNIKSTILSPKIGQNRRNRDDNIDPLLEIFSQTSLFLLLCPLSCWGPGATR
jgi:hypothetical protein